MQESKKYDLKADHASIKRQIKTWELMLDEIVVGLLDGNLPKNLIVNELENLSHEMMAINI